MVKEWFYSDLVATEWYPITLYPIYNGTATKVMKKLLFLWTPIVEVLSTKQLQQFEVYSDPQKVHTTSLDRFLWL